MTCERCGKTLAVTQSACPDCGTVATRSPDRAEQEATATRVLQRGTPLDATQAEVALARANLLRMRGNWDAAAEECAQVLRGDARNAGACSLLGDIYRDQGRAEEAGHWYQMALELNPASEADRLRLARTSEMLDAGRQRAEWEAVIEGRSRSVVLNLQIRESLQRVGALAGAALCGIILMMATLATLSERSPGSEFIPAINPATTRKAARIPHIAETRRESALLQKTNQTVSSGFAQAVRLEVDSRTRRVDLRLSLFENARENVTTGRLRDRIVHEAYRWAFGLRRAAVQLNDPADEWMEVRVVMLGSSRAFTPQPETEVLFDGILHRSDLVVDPEKVGPAELTEFFQRVEAPLWSLELN